MEYGSSAKSLGDRYDLSIGQRRLTPPWKTAEPEKAFDAEVLPDRKGDLTPDDVDGQAKRRSVGAFEREEGIARSLDKAQRSITQEAQALETQLRQSGANADEIAEQMTQRFGQSVSADDVKKGRLWWKIDEMPGAGSEARRVARGRYASTEQLVGTDELKDFLSSDDVRKLTDQGVADMLRQRHGVSASRETINAVRHRLGIPKFDPVKVDVDAFLADDATRALSNKEVSDLIRQKFGVDKTPTAVRQMRERRGLEPPGMHGGGGRAAEEFERIHKLLNSKEYSALNNREAAARLKDEHGLSYSYESIRQFRKRLNED